MRANTAVVKVGAGGRISLLMAETNADVIVDVLGSFGPYGGRVTTITPERDRRLAQRCRHPGRDRGARARSATSPSPVVAACPPDATAVIANVTATNTTAWGFLSAWPTGSRAAVVVEPELPAADRPCRTS